MKKNEFRILHITSIWKGKNYQASQRGTSTWFMTNHKVIIFHLLNYTWPLIQKLHGKMKQKLAILFSCYMTVSRMILTWHLWWMGVVESRYQFSSSWYLNIEYLNYLNIYYKNLVVTRVTKGGRVLQQIFRLGLC